MEITFTTPALLFPAISLVMLAYTNRFMALSSVVRYLHDRYKNDQPTPVIHAQIKNLRYRLKLVRRMQLFGVLSFLTAILCMAMIYLEFQVFAQYVFGITLLLFAVSLVISLLEINISTHSLELELSDMADLDDEGLLRYFKKKFDKD